MSESEKTRKRVALIGFAESWKEAPWNDENVEVWILNEFWKYAPRWDRCFEIHDAETLGVTKRNLEEGEMKRHLEWLSQNHGTKRIYMRPEFCDGRFPNAEPLPLDDMCKRFRAGRYYTSTIAYMVALAIMEGYEWIGLYGIDLASDVEYVDQRPCAEYYIGIAEGRGIEIAFGATAAICKAGHLYGYERPVKERNPVYQAVKQHRDKVNAEREKALAMLNTFDGAIQECDNVLKLHDYAERGAHITGY